MKTGEFCISEQALTSAYCVFVEEQLSHSLNLQSQVCTKTFHMSQLRLMSYHFTSHCHETTMHRQITVAYAQNGG
jgi:hypothetical protein